MVAKGRWNWRRSAIIPILANRDIERTQAYLCVFEIGWGNLGNLVPDKLLSIDPNQAMQGSA